MKKLAFILFISALLFSIAGHSQASLNEFTHITWKVNEYYLDSVLHNNSTIDSVRYNFRLNGILEIRQPLTSSGMVTMAYEYDQINSNITIHDPDDGDIIFHVIYANAGNFVFTTTRVDPVTEEVLDSEFRMVPE